MRRYCCCRTRSSSLGLRARTLYQWLAVRCVPGVLTRCIPSQLDDTEFNNPFDKGHYVRLVEDLYDRGRSRRCDPRSRAGALLCPPRGLRPLATPCCPPSWSWLDTGSVREVPAWVRL
jgi:hypothetical protein